MAEAASLERPVAAYREHAPSPLLAPHIECYWTVDVEVPAGGSVHERVLPDGCMDVLLSLGDPPLTGSSGAAPGRPDESGARAQVVGTMTRALNVGYGGRAVLVGARFRPGAAAPWLPVAAEELTNGTVPLGDLWGARASELLVRVAESDDADGRARALDEVLLARFQSARGRPDEAVLAAVRAMQRTRGAISVDRLAALAGLSARQLGRRFLARVGVTPKVACRVARFRAVIDRFHADPWADLSRLAHATGYADQPHLTREFRSLAGMTPAEYRRWRYGGDGGS